MTRSERREERRKAQEAERKWREAHTITHIEVCDAFATKPQYLGEYDEDGHRPVLNHPHAWFILVTLGDGTRWFSKYSHSFWAIGTGRDDDDMKRCLEEGIRMRGSEDVQPLFQVGPNHATNLEGLIARARMEERAYFIKKLGVLDPTDVSEADLYDPDTIYWERWPYSQYGSEAWEAEMHANEMRERRDPRNW